ncbi:MULTISPECIES: class I SAM-dependent methyltransferase [Streptomyces]|uniref:class I SAM-dependent methyltransferase n=1 Tax=Streptomyces TaxID=1883 RepID=UPI0023B9C04B|nr:MULTISPECIES: class I SAM-dependent methyltransferase [unclassified Streptomyces]MDT0421054.1 methyltransferase domain-containing protein [Streptomyces sp. DSM 41859]WEH27005.1 methyltransferase domain-containing protein [Streptomyces sp. AM 3-1-1]
MGGVPGQRGASREASPTELWLRTLGGVAGAVRQVLVARQLDERLAAAFPAGRRLRVLDVGTGQGTQALRLARAGHEVTGMESDPEMLTTVRAVLAAEAPQVRERVRLLEAESTRTGAHFTPGSFDVVLCHGVLMHVEEPDAVLAGLARVLAAGGLLSLLVRNADALALRPGLDGDWDTALAAFDSPLTRDSAGRTVRADRLGRLTQTLGGIGTPLAAWYGVRVFTDRYPAHAAPPRAEEFDRILDVEDRAGRTDPYRRVAALLHLCGVRG